MKVRTNLFVSLSSLGCQQSETGGVLLTATVASVVLCCECMLLHTTSGLHFLVFQSCLREEKYIRGGLIVSFVPLWQAIPQLQAPQRKDFVLEAAEPAAPSVLPPGESPTTVYCMVSCYVSLAASPTSFCLGAVANQPVIR